MSIFTTELRYMLESYAGYIENQPASKLNDVIDQSRENLFDFSYPSTNLTTSEKEHLEKHIMLHYYFKEIGFETFGLFKARLQSKLWDIMPKYDQLYATEHLNLDFFNDVDYTRKLDSQVDRDGTDTKTGSIRDLNDGYDETVTSGKIISQNSGTITDAKTGTETIANTGYSENTQSGSVVDHLHDVKEHSEDGKIIDAESGKIGKTTTGGYSDTETGQINKVTTGSYTDSSSDTQLNLSSDTPQGEVDISTNDYVASIDKKTGTGSNTRTYSNLMESTQPINHANTRAFSNLKEETDFGDQDDPQNENHKNIRAFDNYEVTDETTSDNTKTYNNLKSRQDDNKEAETTFDTSNTRTDTTKNEQSFDDYKVRNTDTKGRTQTYNNLMNTIDNTDITDLTERIYGNVSGNNIKKLVDYRDSIINIELMIIKDLKPLFMGLFM